MGATQFSDESEQQAGVGRILRIKGVIFRTGLTRGGIYARMGRDEFPKSIGLGGRAVGWLESDIDQWVKERIAQSREGAEQ